jgi:protein-tyrosine phosphatase
MRTRERDRDVPPPTAPWHEITTGLWMGGHSWVDGTGQSRPAVVTDQFELVVTLAVEPDRGPSDDVEHQVLEIPDGPLTSDQIDAVSHIADLVSAAVRDKRSTLVRCRAGYNRSGLVVAQALINLGYRPVDAIELIRRKRSQWALHNLVFEDYLLAGLDVAYLLVGLG